MGEETVCGAFGCVKELMYFSVELVYGEVLPETFDLLVDDRSNCRFGSSVFFACVRSG